MMRGKTSTRSERRSCSKIGSVYFDFKLFHAHEEYCVLLFDEKEAIIRCYELEDIL